MQAVLDFFKSIANWIVSFLQSICRPIAKVVGIRPLYVGFIGLAVGFVFLVLLIVLIVCVKRKKNEKALASEVEQAKKESADIAEQVAEEPAPVVVEEVKEEPVATVEEETKEEPVPKEKKAPAKKTSTVKIQPKKQTGEKAPVAKKLSGKWTVEIKGKGEFISKLSASNGEVMLSSEIYASEDGARNGIQTIIRTVDSGKFVVYQDKNKNYYYKLKTSTNRLLCVGEIYKSKEQCLKAVESVKRIAKDSVIVNELIEGVQYIDYVPSVKTGDAKKGARGKWRIELKDDGMYTSKLYANNGQLMLATEEVAVKKTAETAIASVTKNATEGNFIIDRDKFGRYYYKLRNAQKSVICIGEADESLDSCINAIESVRRFVVNAVIE